MKYMTGSEKYRATISASLLVLLLTLLPLTTRAQSLPDIPDLIRVTVDHSDNGVLIQWNPSTDTDIEYYNVYKLNAHNSFELLFKFSANTLECKHMTSGLKNLAYAVTAEDSTGNESPFGQNVHRAVALSTEFDPCTQSNNLQWSKYEGWGTNISGYRIYGGPSGGPMQLLKFVQSSATSYTHDEVNVNSSYSYYIETVNINGLVSLSPIDTIETLLPDAPSYVIIDHVTVLDESSVELQFSADISGVVNSFRVLRRSNSATPFLEFDTRWNVSQSTQVVLDRYPTGSISYEYLVESLYLPPSCTLPLVISESNTGNGILLVNEMQGETVHLSWTPYESYEPGLALYVIQRRGSNGEFSDVGSVGPSTTQWQENIGSVLDGFQPGEVLYRVIAVSNPTGTGTEEQSISNITAAAIETHMQVPSAFTPGSNDINAEFKPQMDFAPREYLMMVMDRGGRKMFETTDPGEGWDGRFSGGEFVNEAVYVYYIQYTDYTGLFRTFTGNVTVLYP
jgi:gliding motility-associated-like protein